MSPGEQSLARKAGSLTQGDVDKLLRGTEILAAGLSNMYGVYLTPGEHWQANVETGEITYDLGLAAVLDREQQKGVALHEIAHLRFTNGVRIPDRFALDERNAKWAQMTYNLFEDCRIERKLVGEFPGAATPLARLREAFNRPQTAATLAHAKPHMQFLNGLYAIIFDAGAWTTDPVVAGLLAQFREEALKLRDAKDSGALMKGLTREQGGIVDTLIRLRDEYEQQQHKLELDGDEQAADEALFGGEDDDEDDVEFAPEQGATSASEEVVEAEEDEDGEESFEGVGPEAADGEDAPASGDVPAEAEQPASEQGGEQGWESDDMTVPDPDEFYGDGAAPASGGGGEDDGAGVKDESLRGGEDEDEEDGEEASGGTGGDGAGASGGTTPQEGGSDEQELAAMTDEQRQWLDEMLKSLPTEGIELEGEVSDKWEAMDPDKLDVPEAAGELRERLEGGRKMVGEIGDEIHRVMTQREETSDDTTFDLENDWKRYNAFEKIVSQQGNTLGRQLESVLVENKQNRWSAVGYESGGRLHAQNMARVPARERAIFKRKARNKNRQFAVAILQDVSGSMSAQQMNHATLAGITVAEGMNRAQGVEFAYYAFASRNACLKPYTFTLDQRAGKLGAMGQMQGKLGGGTEMATAITRASADMMRRFAGPDWKRLMIVVTDGQPNRADETRRVIREGAVKYDIGMVGIGIQTAGQLAGMFPTWVRIDDARGLAPELVRILRRTIRKG